MSAKPESTISIVMQRIIEREQFGGEVKCQPSELRSILAWMDLAEERSARLQAECEAWRSVDRLTAIFTPNETCDCLIEARRLRAANEQAG